MTTNHTPTLEQLKRGIHIAEQIASLEAEMHAIFGGKAPIHVAAVHVPTTKIEGRRKLSPQALANIRAAQKRRWAKVKGTKSPAAAKASAAAKTPAKKKGGLTAAGRAKLAAAMKRRWAEAKKSGGPAPTAKK